MKIKSLVLLVSLVGLIGSSATFAAKTPTKQPGFGNMDGSTGGRRGGGQTKTGNYNDSADPNAAAQSKHDSIANDPNAGMNKGVKDEIAADAAAMDVAQKKVEKQFESSQEWTDGSAEYDKAKAAYDKARSNVLQALKEKPDYKAAASSAEKSSQALSDLRKGGDATPDQLTAAASASFSAQSAVTKMEKDACAADPDVTAAKAKFNDAATAMTALRQKEHAAVLADADYQSAKQKYDAAKSKTASAAKKD
ncbi:MAG TPA: hypothetical protein VLI90_09800 [Tepidisphaeraceae bacterium]|nr:hypothetical protein [Tepidisphaeraceae bacterium]